MTQIRDSFLLECNTCAVHPYAAFIELSSNYTAANHLSVNILFGITYTSRENSITISNVLPVIQSYHIPQIRSVGFLYLLDIFSNLSPYPLVIESGKM